MHNSTALPSFKLIENTERVYNLKNAFEVRGEVTAIFINSPKYGKFETLISTGKFNKADKLPSYWHLSWNEDTQSFYAHGTIKKENGKTETVSLHRWVMDAPKEMHVDHINHETLDNTDINLRLITQAENNQNLRLFRKNNTSGVRGVSWHKRKNKWQAAIRVNKIQIYLGLFNEIEEAENVVTEARKKYMPYSEETSA